LSVKPDIGIIYHPDFFLHTNDYHPEKKERLQAILALLKEEHLFDKLQQLAPVPAVVDDVAKVHTPDYIRSVQDLCERGRTSLDPDTYLTPDSYEVALLSAGGALTAVQAVLEGRAQGMLFPGASTRPPCGKKSRYGFLPFQQRCYCRHARHGELQYFPDSLSGLGRPPWQRHTEHILP
jgi:acetoin utilization deacetylase AcuC-like enzyme